MLCFTYFYIKRLCQEVISEGFMSSCCLNKTQSVELINVYLDREEAGMWDLFVKSWLVKVCRLKCGKVG